MKHAGESPLPTPPPLLLLAGDLSALFSLRLTITERKKRLLLIYTSFSEVIKTCKTCKSSIMSLLKYKKIHYVPVLKFPNKLSKVTSCLIFFGTVVSRCSSDHIPMCVCRILPRLDHLQWFSPCQW